MEKIKKIFSKKITMAVIVILLISGSSFGFYYFYKSQKELSKNEEFVHDVVSTLKEIYDSKGIEPENEIEKELKDEKFKNLLRAYRRKERLTDAKSIMEKWENDNNKKRKKVIKQILKCLEDLDVVADAFMRLKKRYNSEDAALFTVKLESARGELFPVGLFMHGIRLSQNSKKEIIEKIDLLFEEQIEEYKSNKSQEVSSREEIFISLMASLPPEVSTAIFIREEYALDLGLPILATGKLK